ncbi:MAG: YdiU family protein [Pseudomonadota bacterium]
MDLRLDNRFAQLGEDYFSRVTPTPLPQPQLLHFNEDAAKLIDLDSAEAQKPEFTEIMAGNRPLPGGDPLAMLYAGHQFGSFVPQLGDGRALLIGQVRNKKNESWDLQLKGAGQTPYSRHADGRAVVRSSVREYLCSEAMHGLGIPTTRALCIVTSPEPVQRETTEHAAVLCRMAPSHVRFGSFEVFYYRKQYEKLKPLADHVIAEHFPHHAERADSYAAWLTEVTARTARLMALWQSVGFCHGVMNTDNMSVLGLTLDYGPYGFIDAFDPRHVCNHSDEGGRYAYDQQPGVGHWNISKLLQACLPLLSSHPEAAVERAKPILESYREAFISANLALLRAKLGLREARDNDHELINQWMELLTRSRGDFTRSFRFLAGTDTRSVAPPTLLADHLVDVEGLSGWHHNYCSRLISEQSDDAERAASMNRVNPKYVLRNHLAQAAIEKAEAGDASEIDRLMKLLRRPFDEQPEMAAYFAEPPASAQHISVSCSS